MFHRTLILTARYRWIRLALCSLMMCALTQHVDANSAALGDASVRSSLGQRLSAEIDMTSLTAAEAASVSVKLAPAESWASAGIDLTAIHRTLYFSVEKRDGRHVVRISSDRSVNEPYLHLLVELSADGVRTIRQYVLLIDPPDLISPPSAAATASKASAANTAATDSAADQPALTHTVKRGETLRSIAQQLQPADVQLEQMMASLLSANPHAFAGNNMHRLRSGSQLTIPATETVLATPAEQARHIVRAQTADFLHYQRQLAARSALRHAQQASSEAAAPKNQTSAENLQSSGGSVTLKVTEPVPPPEMQDKLTLSPSGGKEPASGRANTQQSMEAVAANKALADANARIASLEKNINEMQSLLQMKNSVLSEAQQRAESSANSPTAKPLPAANASAASPPVATSPSASQPAVTSPSASKLSASQPTATSPAATSLIPPDDWLPQIDPLLGAGAATGLLLLILLWRLRRRKSPRDDDQPATPIEPTLSQTVIGAAGGRHVDTAHSVFHSNFVPSISQIDTNEVDAVAEADVYIAYGRDEQAEEILLDALRAHPERHALRVKLLEIYAARKDHQRFGTLAAELRVLTHGRGPDWERGAQLGQSLDPNNHLYLTATTGTPAPIAKTDTRHMNSSVSASDIGALGQASRPKTAKDSAHQTAPHVIDFSVEPATPSAMPGAPTAPATQQPRSSAVLNTKLELALACREIGDHAGARELLVEVASARDPELAQRAQVLLQQLA
ncbi:MAG: FimV/HubP family polar landmark protein [Burkholderiaceae bacterium]